MVSNVFSVGTVDEMFSIEPVHHVDDPWTLDGVCPFCDTDKPKEKCRIYWMG